MKDFTAARNFTLYVNDVIKIPEENFRSSGQPNA